LDDGFAGEDDVLRADELVPAGDFVACVLRGNLSAEVLSDASHHAPESKERY
jgi:hypothetical protein